MKVESGKIIRELQELANLSIKSVFYKWKSINVRQVSEFNNIIQDLKFRFEGLIDPTHSSGEIWDIFSNALIDVKKWMNDLNIIPEPEETTELIIDWNQQFKSYIAPYSEEIKIPYEDNFWVARSNDTIIVRAYKRIYLGAIQPVRSKFGKKEGQDNARLRKVELHELLKYHFEQPIDNFIEQEKEIYLKTVSTQIKKIHTQLARLKSVLITKKEPQLKSAPEYAVFKKQCTEAVDTLYSLMSNMNGWKEYESQMDDRFAEFWQEIQREFKSAWYSAGTFQLPSTRFSMSRNKKLRKEFDDKRLKTKKDWYQYFDAVLQNLKKDIEISLTQLHIASACLNLVGNIKSGLSKNIRPNFATIINHINKSALKIKAVKSTNAYKEMFLLERDQFQGSIREKELPQLIDALVSARIDAQLSSFNQTIAGSADVISEKHRLLRFDNGSGSAIPSKSKSIVVETRDVINNAITSEILDTNNQFSKTISSEYEKLMRSVSDVDHVLHFHFEEAARLMGQNSNGKLNEEASIITLDGMNLAKEQLKRLQDESVRLEAQSEDQLLNNIRLFIRRLQDATDNEILFNLKLQSKQIRKKDTSTNFSEELDRFVGSIIPGAEKTITTLSGKARKLSKQFGADAADVLNNESIEKAMGFLAGLDRRIEQVPFVYQRLFNLNPLQEDRFFTGREEEIKLLQSKYEEWREKNRISAAIIAEPGSGVSSFYNIWIQKFAANEKSVHLSLDEHIESIRDLNKRISKVCDLKLTGETENLTAEELSKTDVKICFVENTEKLFQRKVNGMKILRHFLNLTMNTSENIFWILGFNNQTWNYLKTAHNLDRCIPAQIVLKPFSREDINTILGNRHRLSGYNVIFEEGQSIKDLPAYSKLQNVSGKQLLLQQIFFDQLNEMAAGNPMISILYWLSSIIIVEDDNVHLAVERYEPSVILNLMDRQSILILKTIHEHGSLSYQNICEMISLPDHLCKKCLSGLWMKGILTEENGQYFIHPFLQNMIYH